MVKFYVPEDNNGKPRQSKIKFYVTEDKKKLSKTEGFSSAPSMTSLNRVTDKDKAELERLEPKTLYEKTLKPSVDLLKSSGKGLLKLIDSPRNALAVAADESGMYKDNRLIDAAVLTAKAIKGTATKDDVKRTLVRLGENPFKREFSPGNYKKAGKGFIEGLTNKKNVSTLEALSPNKKVTEAINNSKAAVPLNILADVVGDPLVGLTAGSKVATLSKAEKRMREGAELGQKVLVKGKNIVPGAKAVQDISKTEQITSTEATLPIASKEEPLKQVTVITKREPKWKPIENTVNKVSTFREKKPIELVSNKTILSRNDFNNTLNQDNVFIRTVRTPQKDIEGRVSTPSGQLGIKMGLSTQHTGVSGFKAKDSNRLYEWMQREGWPNENVAIYKGKPTKAQTVADRGEVEFNPTEIIAVVPTETFNRAGGDVHKALIIDAIEKGNPVPSKVLNDYPNIATSTPQRQFAQSITVQKGLMPSKGTQQVGQSITKAKTLQPTLSGKKKVSQFKSNTLKNSLFTQGDAQKIIDDISSTYNVKTDKDVLQNVTAQLENNFDGVAKTIKARGLQSKEDSVAAGLIARDYVQKGDYKALKDWVQATQPEVSNLAQTLQGLSTWKKLSPEGALMKAQQVISAANKEAIEKLGKKAKLTELTEQDTQYIIEGMKKVEASTDPVMKDIEFAKVKQFMADLTPVSTREKLKGLQRLSLILNPKSLLVRNPLGNTILSVAENIKDVPGAFIDTVTSAVRGNERTTALNPLSKLKGQAKGFGKGVMDFARDVKYGVDTSPTRGQMELPQGRTFKNPVLNALDQFERRLLQLGDRPFYESAYQGRIEELKKLKNVAEPTEDMIQDAKLFALDRVFQNDSEISKRAMQLRSSLGIVGDLVMPFAQTPANVFDKLLDYSPAGLAKALYHLGTKKGTGLFNQKLFVDRVGRFLTGAGLTALGYVLAKNGAVTGKQNTDKDIANFERNLGKSSYAFKIGDAYQTFDFAQPIAGLLAAGADAYYGGKDKDSFITQVSGGAESAINTMLKQSMFQGIINLVSGYSPAAAIGKTALGATTQITPTLGKQLAQSIDPYVRETYDPNPFVRTGKNLMSRTPGLSTLLPKKVDTFGNEIKSFQGNTGARKIFDVFLNPGFTSEYKPNDVQKEIIRIYEKTGDKVQFPREADKSIEYQNPTTKTKEKIQLTAEDYIKYQKLLGQKTQQKFKEFMDSKEYQLYNDSKKAEYLQDKITQANKEAKQQILREKGLIK